MSDQIDSAMIFAAGLGTRMGALTQRTPKPMLELAGGPMIGRTVQLARQAGVQSLVANTHYLHDSIAPYLAEHNVQVVQESPKILDTGGGLKNANRLLSSPTFTVNPDVVWLGVNPFEVLQNAWTSDMDALLLVVPVSGSVNRKEGDFSLHDGRLQRHGDMIYTGAQIIRTEVLREVDLNSFSMNVVWDILINRDALSGCVYPDKWCDIGTPDGLDLANSLLSSGSDV
ncbi:MAG: nucleotidyltransferase family protein [Boseongicola sp.]|nr:nucleotidyltransferase family protein [Boseongicola sp.]MDD9979374.1 nucleotidyltransferase family protein [Boseongicola sp.]